MSAPRAFFTIASLSACFCDNTQRHRAEYADYFALIDNPTNGFRTMTLPFDGGLELSVHCQR